MGTVSKHFANANNLGPNCSQNPIPARTKWDGSGDDPMLWPTKNRYPNTNPTRGLVAPTSLQP
jgi:hypothetical protein